MDNDNYSDYQQVFCKKGRVLHSYIVSHIGLGTQNKLLL